MTKAHNVEETENLNTLVEEVKTPEDISFNTEEMFNASGINPEKLTKAEKEKYLKLNQKFFQLQKRLDTLDYVICDRYESWNRGNRIEISNPENGSISTIYPYVSNDGKRLPTLPELVVRDEKGKLVGDAYLSVKEYEAVLDKCSQILDTYPKVNRTLSKTPDKRDKTPDKKGNSKDTQSKGNEKDALGVIKGAIAGTIVGGPGAGTIIGGAIGGLMN